MNAIAYFTAGEGIRTGKHVITIMNTTKTKERSLQQRSFVGVVFHHRSSSEPGTELVMKRVITSLKTMETTAR